MAMAYGQRHNDNGRPHITWERPLVYIKKEGKISNAKQFLNRIIYVLLRPHL